MSIENSIIGNSTKIWRPELVNIYQCKIGEGCNIGAFVEIGANVEIGNRCRIQAYSFIPKGVKIGDDVFIGPRVTFLNDKYPPFGDFKTTIVEDEVIIGGCAIILPGVTLHKGCKIAAGTIITHDIGALNTAIGIPARIIENEKWHQKIIKTYE